MHRLQRKSRPAVVSSRRWMAALVSRLGRIFTSLTFRGVDRAKPTSLGEVGPRILVVDDNPSNLWDARELLARHGLSPIMAGDGAEAVALACGHDFDLILMDLQMPVLDGLEATKQIRRHEREHDSVRASVLAYTSHFPDADLLRDCGVDGVLEKPCSDRALQACLIRWCVPKMGTHHGLRATAARERRVATRLSV